MSARDNFLAALNGQDVVSFSALTWERLPGFLNATAGPDWWLDVGYCGRALVEAATLCGSEAIQIPLLRFPDPLITGDMPPATTHVYEQLASRRDVKATFTIIDQLSTLGQYGILGVIPSISFMHELWPDMSRDDLEDDTSDLVSGLFELGADGVVIRGPDKEQVKESTDLISRLARHFGRVAIGATPGEAWSSEGLHTLAVASPDKAWPRLSRGVLLSTSDLSRQSPRELQDWLASRPRTLPFSGFGKRTDVRDGHER